MLGARSDHFGALLPDRPVAGAAALTERHRVGGPVPPRLRPATRRLDAPDAAAARTFAAVGRVLTCDHSLQHSLPLHLRRAGHHSWWPPALAPRRLCLRCSDAATTQVGTFVQYMYSICFYITSD